MMGDNLSGIKIQYLMGDSAEELKAQLDQIRVPYKIFNIYACGPRHYAWINSSMPIRINKKKQNNKGLENGSISG